MSLALVDPQAFFLRTSRGFSLLSSGLMNSVKKEICHTQYLHQELHRKIVMNPRKINKDKFRKHN